MEEDASDDSDADDAELTEAIAEARIAARRLSLSVDEAPPPPPPTRTRSAPVPHKRRLSHEERATPLSHLRHLLGGRSASADRPASPPPAHVARASMAAARGRLRAARREARGRQPGDGGPRRGRAPVSRERAQARGGRAEEPVAVVLVVKEVFLVVYFLNFLNCDSGVCWGTGRVSVTSTDFPTETRCLGGYRPGRGFQGSR